MHLTGVSTRRIPAAALPLGLLMVAGCAFGGAEPAGPSEAELDSICAEIEAELRQRDDVAQVDVYYQDFITVPRSASVDITMTPGADPQAINDEAVRLVWQSELEPLATIDVSVTDPVEPINGVASSFYLGEESEREALEEQYGPRPD